MKTFVINTIQYAKRRHLVAGLDGGVQIRCLLCPAVFTCVAAGSASHINIFLAKTCKGYDHVTDEQFHAFFLLAGGGAQALRASVVSQEVLISSVPVDPQLSEPLAVCDRELRVHGTEESGDVSTLPDLKDEVPLDRVVSRTR